MGNQPSKYKAKPSEDVSNVIDQSKGLGVWQDSFATRMGPQLLQNKNSVKLMNILEKYLDLTGYSSRSDEDYQRILSKIDHSMVYDAIQYSKGFVPAYAANLAPPNIYFKYFLNCQKLCDLEPDKRPLRRQNVLIDMWKLSVEKEISKEKDRI